jgi:hypothetical protein
MSDYLLIQSGLIVIVYCYFVNNNMNIVRHYTVPADGDNLTVIIKWSR